MNRLLLISIYVSLFSCQEKPDPGKSKTFNESVSEVSDSLTDELIDIHTQGYINGFSVAIVNEKGILYQNGFGYANVESKQEYSNNTIQPIGSISKTFIGIALLKAQEMGKLNLDDPINDYLPFQIDNPYYPEDVITIRHLANHSSSITDTEYYDKSYMLRNEPDSSSTISVEILNRFSPPGDSISMFDFLKRTLDAKGVWYKKESFLKAKPGENFKYSNAGATLAALIIELSTQMPYYEFTTKYILNPLGMSSSGWSFSEVNHDKFSKLYMSPDAAYPFYYLITYPDGGFITSSNDMGKYLIELIKGYSGKGTLLNKESYDEIFGTQLDADNFFESEKENPFMDVNYNKGIFMGFAPKGYIGHTGGDPGVVSFMFFNSQNKVGRILIINTDIQGDNEEAINELWAIWDKLDEYKSKLSS